jgi:ATP phosphoribosyltransferase regulatory subunit HisZ
MFFEHEIPSSSRLYFGKSAKLKREIENTCSSYLEDNNFSEIVTPLFSYHQQESFLDSKGLVRLNDATNDEVSLRADSTVDVVRIVTKRLSRSEDVKRWFYIQPIFAFPTCEQYQVGAEIIDGSLEEVANNSLKLLSKLKLDFNFQVANIAVAHLLIANYGFDLDDIKNIRLQKILDSKYEWIAPLVEVNTIEDLEDLSIYPEDIKVELIKIRDAVANIDREDILISPLYYAPMRYYKSLVFRAFKASKLYSTGGIYSIKGVNGAGFAIYTDDIIANKMQRD